MVALMAQPESPAPPPLLQPPPRRRRGCFFYGCLGTLVIFLVVVIAGYLGFRYAIERFTDDHPLPLPKTQMSVADLQRLHGRIADFSRALDDGKSAGPLTLTSDEANALIQTDANWAFLKGQLYVTFESNRLNAQLSVPAEQLGSIRLRGRYLNASGSFTVSLRRGQLEVNVLSLAAKGRPVPENIMQHIRTRNFALSFTNTDSNLALSKLGDVEIRDGKLIVTPKVLVK